MTESYDRLLHPGFIADKLSPEAMEALGTMVLDGLQQRAEAVARADLPTESARVAVVFNTLPRWHEYRRDYPDRKSFSIATTEVERRNDEDIARQSHQPVARLTLVRSGVAITKAQRRRLAGTDIVRVPSAANDATALNLAVETTRREHRADIMVIGDSCSSYATTEALRSAALWLGGKESPHRRVWGLQGPRLPDDVSSEIEVVADLAVACRRGLTGAGLPSNPLSDQIDLMAELAAVRVTPAAGEMLFSPEYGNDGAMAAYLRRMGRLAVDDPAFARHTGRGLTATELLLTLADRLRSQRPNRSIPAPPPLDGIVPNQPST
jgi:hypothetical protein